MNKRLLIAGLFFILICFSGCILQSPGDDPPYSVLPILLLDYDFDSDETKIWVKSALSDYKYTNITIEIFNNVEYPSIDDVKPYLHAETREVIIKAIDLVLTDNIPNKISRFNNKNKIVAAALGIFIDYILYEDAHENIWNEMIRCNRKKW